MSGQSHTPGPWMCPPVFNSMYGVPVVASTGKRIANTADFPELLKDEECRTEALANARLIAAAPEMLSVLEECKSFLRDLTQPDAAASAANIIASYANAISLRLRVVNAVAAASKTPAPPPRRTAPGDGGESDCIIACSGIGECFAASVDGVICPDDTCDYDTGVRSPPTSPTATESAGEERR